MDFVFMPNSCLTLLACCREKWQGCCDWTGRSPISHLLLKPSIKTKWPVTGTDCMQCSLFKPCLLTYASWLTQKNHRASEANRLNSATDLQKKSMKLLFWSKFEQHCSFLTFGWTFQWFEATVAYRNYSLTTEIYSRFLIFSTLDSLI